MLPQPQTVILATDGIHVTTPQAQGCNYWLAVKGIDTTPTHALIHLAEDQAVVVPARAFRSKAQFHGFVDLARQYWQNATGR